jgi:glycosyltransferase involved in cell wall biosynthesis
VTVTETGPGHPADPTDLAYRPVGRARVGRERAREPLDERRPPRQSLVIPTRDGSDNIAALLTRLSAMLPAADTEIVIVDDSTDNTPELIAACAASCPIPVRVHHREEPACGRGGAVIEGLRLARGAWLVVLDADLRHPPETVPDLIAAGIRDGADLVVASRYAAGGSRPGLADGYRHLVAQGFRLLTKVLFRTALIQVSDPMSGFFAVRASSLELADLRPLGDRVLLELVTNSYQRINDLNAGHWYPSATELGNGDVLSLGGLGEDSSGTVTTEYFSNAQQRWLGTGEAHQTWSFWGLYPSMVLMQDGRLFYTGSHVFGNGLPGTGSSIYDYPANTVTPVSGLQDKDERDQSMSVLLPPRRARRC